ncbi:MAG: flotillin family protein [Deltaproteobacteria bacterium]|nr:MAG: flotillin family protein [Deltaproteobacteria bacterium]
MLKLALLIGGIVAFAGLCIAVAINKFLEVCEPNEALVFAGRGRKVGGRMVGYQLVKGGRRLRIPLFERVYRMDLTNIPIPLSIRNAYSKGGIPLNIDAVANVKIASNEPIIDNAIERLLGKSRSEVMSIAKETLEGNLRGVLATLTPEQVNEDKTAFQKNLVEEAEQDLERLGLKLDTLNIQNISDEKGYLDSIGRKQAAEIRKQALIAEATSQSESAIKSAENEREISMAQIQAQTETAKAEADRRIIDATTRRTAVVAEQEADIAALIAKATAEVEVQKARIEQTRRRLAADVVAPAQAQMQSNIAEAAGQAAKIVEDGQATANALRAVTATWKQAGDNARDIFLMQKMDVLMKHTLQTIQSLQVNQLTLLPATGNHGSVPGGSSPSARTASLVSTSEQLKAALGIDVPKFLQDIMAQQSSKSSGWEEKIKETVGAEGLAFFEELLAEATARSSATKDAKRTTQPHAAVEPKEYEGE